MTRYDSYKDSGVEWIGEIPSHWGFEKTKTLCERKKKTISAEEFKNQNVIHYSIPNVQAFGTGVKELGEDIDSSKLLFLGGEVLVSKLNPRKGCVTRVRFHNDIMVIGSGEFIPLVPGRNLSAEFFHYFIQSPRYSEFLDSNVESVTRSHQRVSPDVIYDLRVPLPQPSEQERIVEYLDRKTTAIDSLIEKKVRKIELLKEKRTSLINEVVTKGLNPDVEMKDSGVEWIGEIPSHWGLIKLRRICSVKRGSSPRPIDDPQYFDDSGQFKWVRIADVSKSDKYLFDTRDTLSELGSSLSTKIYPNQLFLSIAGSVGKPIISRVECCIHDGFVWFDGLDYNPEYLYYVFLLGTCFSGLGKMGTQLNLNTDTVGDIYIPLITSEQQHDIVTILNQKTAAIDSTITTEEKRIELLKEYRQSLISEAVTGKRKI